MANDCKIGVIHEIGDMGLGFQELTAQEKLELERGKEETESKRKEGSRG